VVCSGACHPVPRTGIVGFQHAGPPQYYENKKDFDLFFSCVRYGDSKRNDVWKIFG